VRLLVTRRAITALTALALAAGCSAVLGIDDIPLAGHFEVATNGRSCGQLVSDLESDLGSVCPGCVSEQLPVSSFTCTPGSDGKPAVAYCTCAKPDASGGSGGGTDGSGSMPVDSGSGGSGGISVMDASGGSGGKGGAAGSMTGGARGSDGSGGSDASTCDAGFQIGGLAGIGGAGDCTVNKETCVVTCINPGGAKK
jgi:hypothetical protein